MDNHPIENLMKTTMENIKGMVDVNTIVGDAVEHPDGTTIIPISKVSFGFASGGSEFSSSIENNLKSHYPFGGGSGAGVTIKPVAFLVVKGETVRLMPMDHPTTSDKIVDTVPQILDMFKDFIQNKSEDKE